ncbi:MAG TPA: VOC family protein, partial [Dehalococcoidia bacterium]|nr:VOC family protein [Dehalococcoidia bacterium]
RPGPGADRVGPPVFLELSQVILGVQDLAAAADRVAALGFTVLDGGCHPGLGTANRIVPLGRQYLELLGVVDKDDAAAHGYGQALLRAIADGDRLGLRPEARSRR